MGQRENAQQDSKVPCFQEEHTQDNWKLRIPCPNFLNAHSGSLLGPFPWFLHQKLGHSTWVWTPIYEPLYLRVSKLHEWHLGKIICYGGTSLWIVYVGAYRLLHTRCQQYFSFPTPNHDNQKYLQTLSNVPSGWQNHTQLSWSEGSRRGGSLQRGVDRVWMCGLGYPYVQT